LGVDYRKRVVMRMPLDELWDSDGPVAGSRCEQLDRDAIKEIIGRNDTRIVVADIGAPLKWLVGRERFRLWKEEVAPRLAPPWDGWRLESFPGEYCYVASRWVCGGANVILFEKHH
jgi:hypothetical protein